MLNVLQNLMNNITYRAVVFPTATQANWWCCAGKPFLLGAYIV